MTANELANEFEIRYDKITNFAAPGYEDDEISALLNDATERFIKSVYQPKGNRYREGFEGTEKRRKDLSELIRGPKDLTGTLVTSIAADQDQIVQYGRMFNLPTDFWLAIYEEALTDEDDCTSSTTPKAKLRVRIEPVTHDEYVINKKNPYRKPYIDANDGMVWRLDFSREAIGTNPKRHELVTDGTFNVTEYYLRYVKKPRKIVVDRTTPANQVDCELDEMTHSEIVDIAVRRAVGITDPKEYQIKLAEEQNKE